MVEITVFSVVKTGLAKIVFAGKNRFLPEYFLQNKIHQFLFVFD